MTDDCTKRTLVSGRTTALTFPKRNITSHVMPGSNTMLPFLEADKEFFDLEEKCLMDAATLEIVAPDIAERGRDIYIEAEITNVGAGHDLPTAVGNQLWLDVKVTDAGGETIYRSGGVNSRGYVDPDAVSFGSFSYDEHGELILVTIGVDAIESVDTRIPAKESRMIGYLVNVPEDAVGPLEVNARLRYRFHPQNVINFVFVEHSRDTEANFDFYVTRFPITDLAEDQITLELK